MGVEGAEGYELKQKRKGVEKRQLRTARRLRRTGRRSGRASKRAMLYPGEFCPRR